LVIPPVEVAAARLPSRQRHRPHRAVRGGDEVRDALAALLALELFLALRGAEVLVGDQRETLLQGELLGAGTHQRT